MDYIKVVWSNISSMDSYIFYLAGTIGADLNRDILFSDTSHLYKSGLVLFVIFFIFWIIFHFFIHELSSYISCQLFPIQSKSKTSQSTIGDIILKKIAKSDVRRRYTNKECTTLSSENKGIHNNSETVAEVLSKRIKFNIAFWKSVNYLFLVSVGYKVLSSAYWITDYYLYASSVKVIDIAASIYYHLAISSYVYGSYCLLREPKLKDFYVMLSHHVVTLLLLVGSYYCLASVRIGMMVMILHDVCDPWMELAKVCLYSNFVFAANVFFVIFSIVFIISRCVIYPSFVIYPALYLTADELYNYNIGVLHLLMLCIIFLMDIYWTFLILRMIYTQLINGRLKGDVREELDNEREHSIQDNIVDGVAKDITIK